MKKTLPPFESKPGTQLDCLKATIMTSRLMLRPICKEDAPEIFKNFTAEVTRYMIPKYAEKIEDTLTFIRESLEKTKQQANIQFVILNRKTHEFLGCCGVHIRDNAKTPELGIWIKKSAHGNGYGREAICEIKNYCDKNLMYDYLIYPVDKANIASIKIPEALDGEIFKEGKKSTEDGRELYVVVYRIYPEEKIT